MSDVAREYTVKAAGWPERKVWSYDSVQAAKDYFNELVEVTDFNPVANNGVAVKIVTEIGDERLTWEVSAEFETELHVYTRGRHRPLREPK